MRGNREEVLEIIINPEALEAYQISGEELIGVLARNNRLVPAGSLDNGEGRFALKVPSVIEEASDLFDLPVKTTADAVITLSDVATIRRSFKDRGGFVRVNGQTAITINVTKRSKANIIETVAAAKAIVDAVKPDLPGRIEIIYTTDQAPWALAQVNELQGNILTALALVMVIVVAAMGFRSGLIVGLGIPVSLLFAITILYVIGFTYNFMVMFGMLLALGMLIDGAIVVTEYADRRMLEGEHRRQAYASQADVLARGRLDCDHLGGVSTADVLAGDRWQVHALSACYGFCSAVRQSDLRVGFWPGDRRVNRPARRRSRRHAEELKDHGVGQSPRPDRHYRGLCESALVVRPPCLPHAHGDDLDFNWQFYRVRPIR
jgi:hypothetical protein